MSVSRLTDLIQEAKRLNPELGEAIDKEVKHLQDRRAFGLNFERHAPEAVDLFGRPVRLGDKVRMLAPRGETAAPDTRLWKVTGATGTGDDRIVQLRDDSTGDTAEHPLTDLVVVAESNDVIYPGLESTRRIELDGDKPFHTVVNAENLHALKALLYTHRASIDCIYIDPPYNTGNDDWIYSDRYVGGEDLYRHSKWLSFMERRLVLAKELLKDTGFILVSIDDREQSHLRLLMEQVFGSDNFIATFIWRSDGNIDNQAQIKINHEYVLMFSRNKDLLLVSGVKDPNLDDTSKLHNAQIRNSVIKNGPKNPPSSIEIPPGFPANFENGSISARTDKYPNYDTDLLVRGGRLQNAVTATTGWANGRLLRNFISNGFVPVIDSKGQSTSFELTSTGAIENVKERRGDQHHILTVLMNMGTVEVAGNILRDIGLTFPFPKPQGLMSYLVSLAPENAVVLDYFGGSGSTLEAVIRENATQRTRRQGILITNNEVGKVKMNELTQSGARPSDKEWNDCGVHDAITHPRIVAVTTGERPDGTTFEDTVPANVEFFKLTYEAPLKVKSHHDFLRIAPLLWLRAGARGRRIEELPEGWDVADAYGVIDRLERVDQFVAALEANPEATLAYVVTDDERRFQTVCADLPVHVEPVRLYESYLRNFEIDAARSAR